MAAEYNREPEPQEERLEARLARHTLLLDGATGTELERRGVPSELPLWSALALRDAPEKVLEIHEAYVRAGVDLLTANTFRTQRGVWERAGIRADARALCAWAVDLARQAAHQAKDRKVFVLGSAPPLMDCYRPDWTPEEPVLAREHAHHAQALVDAGVDAILAETHPTRREARAAARAARQAGVPFLVSFVCQGGRLLSGESLEEALADLRPLAPLAVGVNCLPPSEVAASLPALRSSGLPFLISPNLGAPEPGGGRTEPLDPEAFARAAGAWQQQGARILGGCCGTTPEHIRAVARRLRPSA